MYILKRISDLNPIFSFYIRMLNHLEKGEFCMSYWIYCNIIVPFKVFKIRRKKKIKVLFILTELGPWKTETLYLKMAEYERFIPIILIAPSTEYPDNSAYEELRLYLEEKKYQYIFLGDNETIQNVIKPDIIFYQKPYKSAYLEKYRMEYNMRSLFCYTGYGFHAAPANWTVNLRLHCCCWHYYFENSTSLKEAIPLMLSKGKNCRVTGIPMQDLLLDKSYNDPWAYCRKKLKRVIWAPHHTIFDKAWLHYSTFLDYYNFMLYIALTYKDRIQFAFKPHPLLYPRLIQVWGKEKTESYYNKWRNLENGQIVLGKYKELFDYSDALIHDCGSFTVEYHYTHNPVMYLVRNHEHEMNDNAVTKEAFNLHYKGFKKMDIIEFLDSVVLQGNDPMKAAREKFFNDHLLPPNGKSACDNIIDSILGK